MKEIDYAWPRKQPASATRRRKDALLPQVCVLALAGESRRKIAATCGLPKSTVNRWLQRSARTARRGSPGIAEMIADAVAGYSRCTTSAGASPLAGRQGDGAHRADRDGPRSKEEKDRPHGKPGRQPGLSGRRSPLLGRDRQDCGPRCAARGKWGKAEGERRRAEGRKREGEGDENVAVPSRPGKAAAADQGLIPPEAMAKDDSPKISQDYLSAPSSRRPGRNPWRDCAVQPCSPSPSYSRCHQGRQDPREEGALPEGQELNSADYGKCPGSEKGRTGTGMRPDEMGQAVATRMKDDMHSKERQPPVSAGFSTRQPRPVVESRCAVRGSTRRKTSAMGFNRPVLIAAAGLAAARDTGRSDRRGRRLRKGVGAAAEDSG